MDTCAWVVVIVEIIPDLFYKPRDDPNFGINHLSNEYMNFLKSPYFTTRGHCFKLSASGPFESLENMVKRRPFNSNKKAMM